MRIALYGDVNLNLIDGSAIWLAALAEVLALDPACRVTVVLKSPIERDLVVAPLLARDNVDLVSPPDAPRRLTPTAALDEIERLDAQQRFDVVLLRGFELCVHAARRPTLHGRLWTYLTDIPQEPALAGEDDRARLAEIARASQRVLCQTDELRAYLEGLIPDAAWRTLLLTPMVPDAFVRPVRELSTTPKLFYAGKFAPAWGFLETVDAFRKLRQDHPDLELHVAGDKVHDPPDDPGYKPAVTAALQDTDGLVWHGAVIREQVADLLATCDVALSARHPSMDASLELSTKVLEYGAANVPVVLNRNPLHERLFGADYPLFIEELDELAVVLDRTLADAARWRRARDTAHRVATAYTFERVRERLAPALTAARPQREQVLARRKVLISGHDLKFTGPLAEVLRRAGAEIRQDVWTFHASHDPVASQEALDWADAIWAEWCLGNAVWYAARRRPDQRMIVRLHRQELNTEFPAQVDHDAVDRLVCVAPMVADAAKSRFGWREDRVEVLPNTIDTIPFDRPKLPGAEFTLGLVGFLPSLKRLDRALDLLELLLDDDPRWNLRVAGALPWEQPWVWARLTEREYYRDQFDRVRTSDRLRRAVRFEGRIANIPGWFAAVGTILSVSDIESFHLALAEGMASRAVPLVMEREGAAELFPGVPLHTTVGQAATHLLGLDADERARIGAAGRALVEQRYGLTTVGAHWVDLLLT
ncbi:MAG: glycosyltransferase family 4 protein [Actinobacteria bacterium]|jgi:glycosyltransferase involved in cell wall biosynthesis|nr:glycosyltransferase family 4 protein [Actinomycetota bacterium]